MPVQNDVILQRKFQISIVGSRLYSESMIALYYMHNAHKSLKMVVARCMATILIPTNLMPWSHIKSEDNIADMACRSVRCCIFFECEQWKAGPDLLTKPAIVENQEERDCVSEHDLLLWEPEVKKWAACCATSSINTANTLNDHFVAALSCAIFSRTKLKKVTAYFL